MLGWNRTGCGGALLVVLWLCAPCGAEEKFIAPAWFRTATVEMRSEASVPGPAITFRQVARWGDADALMLDAAADLVVARFDKDQRQRSVDLRDLKVILEGAGVNLATVNFTGSAACAVKRTGDEPAAKPAVVVQDVPVKHVTAAAVVSSTPIAAEAQPAAVQVRSLRELLTDELVERFGLPLDAMVVRFNPQDERLLNLSEPAYSFDIRPRKQRNLGDITWDIIVTTGGGKQQVAVTANVRAWQTQLVATRAMAAKQVFADEDLIERRVLVDRLNEQVPLRKDQAVGQQAARDIPAGMPLSNVMVEAVQMIKLGELVTVTVFNGRIQLKWVAEAREHGALGQSIRVRKPNTREEFSVVVTGPQQARLIGPAGDRVAGR